jgi:ParB family transcriptional regulator, chromosome partitioning protein
VSSPRRFGLPAALRMRHDPHFVDQLGRPSGVPVGRLVPLEDIDPNPNQPRQALGDLTELVASVREKGVLEPILVRPKGSRFEIVAGERRYRAASEVGLAEIPCIVRDASDAEMMELALIENLQRKDLTPFEEADGLKTLVDSYAYTHEMMAKRLGKSRTSITEGLSLAAMPEEVRERCRRADIEAKSLLLQVVRQSEPQKMVAFVDRLEREGVNRDEARRLTRESRGGTRGRPRNFVFRYRAPDKSCTLTLQFSRAQVGREDVISALESIAAELRHGGE